jgi:signal transduction histidine kinase
MRRVAAWFGLGDGLPWGRAERPLWAPLVGLLAASVAIGIVAWWAGSTVDANEREVVHSYQVIEQLTRTVSTLQDVEGGARGYGVTGDVRFLDSYDAGLAQYPRQKTLMLALAAGDSRIEPKVRRFLELGEQRIESARTSVAVREQLGAEAFAEYLADGQGKRLMDQVRELADQLDSDERRILEQSLANSRTARERGHFVMWSLGGTVIALGGAGALLGRKTLRAERRATAAARSALDATERASSARIRLLTRVSHELRTPLNVILGFGQVLQEEDLEPEQERRVDLIVSSGRHMMRLVEDVLHLARADAGSLQLAEEPVHLQEKVAEAAALVEALADEAGVAVSVEPLPGRNQLVMADGERVTQVLLNLLSNAVKYNYPGGKVGVALERRLGMLRVNVRDTGPGIPEGQGHLLFEPFQRLGAERGTVPGTGLGLAVSRRLVEAMGGQIGSRSEPGQGSTFWFELPLAPTG